MDFWSPSDWILQLGEVEEDPMGVLMYENQMNMSCNFDNDFLDLSQPFDHLSSFGTSQSPSLEKSSAINSSTNTANNDNNNNNCNDSVQVSPLEEGPTAEPERLSKLPSTGADVGTLDGSSVLAGAPQRIISFGGSNLEDPVRHESCHVHIPYNQIGPYQCTDAYSAYADALNKAAQEHVLSERRRREKIAEKFLGLTAVLPDLPKMTNASILEQAISYVKQLQEQIEFLEKQTRCEDVSSSLDTQVFADHDHVNYCSEENYFKTSPFDKLQHPFLEILARSRDRSVLIRAMICNKKNDFDPTSKILRKIGTLKLTPICHNVIPFGHSKLIITVISQMNDDFHMTLEDLVKHLQLAISPS